MDQVGTGIVIEAAADFNPDDVCRDIKVNKCV